MTLDFPSPSTAKKLRKHIAQEDKDQGWINDGTAVRGWGAHKGSARKRSALPGTSTSSLMAMANEIQGGHATLSFTGGVA
jgi:hypothetical protein